MKKISRRLLPALVVSALVLMLTVLPLSAEGETYSDLFFPQNGTNYAIRDAVLAALGLTEENADDQADLEAIAGITELDLSGKGLQDIRPLQNLTGLQWLDLSNNDLYGQIMYEAGTQVKTLEALQNLSLTYLNLSGNGNFNSEASDHSSNFSPIQNMTSLQELDLSGCDLVNMNGLDGLPDSITTLNLSGCDNIGDGALEKLPQSLVTLNLASCPVGGPTGMPVLGNLPNLTNLDLSNTYVADSTVAALVSGSNKSLTNLNLSGCGDISDEGAKALANAAKANGISFTNLDVTGTAISEDVIAEYIDPIRGINHPSYTIVTVNPYGAGNSTEFWASPETSNPTGSDKWAKPSADAGKTNSSMGGR